MKNFKRISAGFLASLALANAAFAALPFVPPPASTTQSKIVPSGACDGKSSFTLTTVGSNASITGPFTALDAGKAISIYAGSSVALTGGITSTNSRNLQVASTTGLIPGQNIQGTNIPAGAYITGLNGSLTFQISQPATASGSSLSFTAYNVVNTTISSAGAGQATLAVAPTSSLTALAWGTWGTDATASIQAAETAASAAGGGIVRLPIGMCIVSASVGVDGNVSIDGYGAGQSILKWISSSDMTTPVILTNNPNAGSCNYANALPWHDNHFSNFEIDALSATQASYNVSGKGISFSCSVRSVVQNMYVHDTPASAVATDAGMPTLVINNVLANCGRLAGATGAGGSCIGEGLAGVSQESYQISNNQIINPGHYGIFMETQQSSTAPATCTVSGNVIYQGPNSQPKTSAGGAGIGNSGGTGCSIVGNYIYGFSNSIKVWAGISQDGGTTNNKSGIQSIIANNYISLTNIGILLNNTNVNASSNINTIVQGNSINGTIAGPCIQVTSGTTDTTMNNISIVGNQGFKCASSGLLISGASTLNNISIENNLFYDNGVVAGTTDYQKSGIAIGANVGNLQVIGNRLYDDGNSTQKYGFSVNTGIAVTGAQFTNNQFSSNTTSQFDMLGTMTGILASNGGMPAPTTTGCSATINATSNGDVGSYTSGTTGTCAIVVTPYGTANILAPHGYVADSHDLTTPADTQTQTASSTSTFTLSGTTISSDVVNYKAAGW